MTTAEMIEAMQACIDGKEIQYKANCEHTWRHCINPSWNWAQFQYRVRPEPREFWVNCYANENMHAYTSKGRADNAAGKLRTECIHVREITESQYAGNQ